MTARVEQLTEPGVVSQQLDRAQYVKNVFAFGERAREPRRAAEIGEGFYGRRDSGRCRAKVELDVAPGDVPKLSSQPLTGTLFVGPAQACEHAAR